MVSHIKGKMYGAHIEFTMYGDSYREYNVWRHIYRVQCTETI